MALYSILTANQVFTEGELINDSLHLHDDDDNYKLAYFRDIKLGLGFIDVDIKAIIQQQKILNTLLNYIT